MINQRFAVELIEGAPQSLGDARWFLTGWSTPTMFGQKQRLAVYAADCNETAPPLTWATEIAAQRNAARASQGGALRFHAVAI